MSKRRPHRWLRHICRGETADLWLGLEGRESFVAKILRPYLGETDDSMARRFDLELELHHQLRSSGRFLSVSGVGEAGDPVAASRRCRFMRSATETGASLERMLATDKIRFIKPELVNYIGYELLQSVTALHEVGFGNMAMDARNVLITTNNKVTVFDLGHAVRVGLPDVRWAFREAWSPYRSPETAWANTEAAQGTGMYGVGIIMRRLMAPQEPFVGVREGQCYPTHETDYLELEACLELFKHWGYASDDVKVRALREGNEEAAVVELCTQGKTFVVNLNVDCPPAAFLHSYPFWNARFRCRPLEEQARILEGAQIMTRQSELGASVMFKGISIPRWGEEGTEATKFLRGLAETDVRLH